MSVVSALSGPSCRRAEVFLWISARRRRSPWTSAVVRREDLAFQGPGSVKGLGIRIHLDHRTVRPTGGHGADERAEVPSVPAPRAGTRHRPRHQARLLFLRGRSPDGGSWVDERSLRRGCRLINGFDLQERREPRRGVPTFPSLGCHLISDDLVGILRLVASRAGLTLRSAARRGAGTGQTGARSGGTCTVIFRQRL